MNYLCCRVGTNLNVKYSWLKFFSHQNNQRKQKSTQSLLRLLNPFKQKENWTESRRHRPHSELRSDTNHLSSWTTFFSVFKISIKIYLVVPFIFPPTPLRSPHLLTHPTSCSFFSQKKKQQKMKKKLKTGKPTKKKKINKTKIPNKLKMHVCMHDHVCDHTHTQFILCCFVLTYLWKNDRFVFLKFLLSRLRDLCGKVEVEKL